MILTKFLKEDDFWALIENANKQNIQEAAFDDLVDALSQKSIEEIVEFNDFVNHFLQISFTSHLWCVAYVTLGGCSDDSFDYFRAWLISKGKLVFEEALKEPDSLLSPLKKLLKDEEEPEFEDFLLIASDAYFKKTGFDQDNYYEIENKLSIFDLSQYQNDTIIFDWKEEDEESMKKICPKIFKAFS